MARRILEGMQKACVVFHSTSTIREQILKHGLIDPLRLVQAPYGIAPEFNAAASHADLPPDLAGAIANGFSPSRGQLHSAQTHRRAARRLRQSF